MKCNARLSFRTNISSYSSEFSLLEWVRLYSNEVGDLRKLYQLSVEVPASAERVVETFDEVLS